MKWYRRKYRGTAAQRMADGGDIELPLDGGLHPHSELGLVSLLKERKKTGKSSDRGRHVLTLQGADSLSSDVAVNLIISGGPPGNQMYKIGIVTLPLSAHNSPWTGPPRQVIFAR